MSSIVSLIIRNVTGIAVFGGMWLSVTSVQNGNDEFAIIGVLFSLFALGLWAWDQNAKREKKSFWSQYE